MEQIITEICNDDLKKEAFTNTQFIFFAERGAMGEAGKILIVTSGGSIFHGNYCFGNIKINSLYRAVPILKVCNFGTLGEVTGIPDDWKYEYLGAGNHLLIRNNVYADFKEALSDATFPDEIYLTWLSAAWSIIEKQNIGKSPLETKTSEELAILMNTAGTSALPLSEGANLLYKERTLSCNG